MASKYNWGDKLLIFLKSYERTPKITREKYYSLLSTDKEVCLLWLFASVVRQYEMTPPFSIVFLFPTGPSSNLIHTYSILTFQKVIK